VCLFVGPIKQQKSNGCSWTVFALKPRIAVRLSSIAIRFRVAFRCVTANNLFDKAYDTELDWLQSSAFILKDNACLGSASLRGTFHPVC
jgi:hypothetical protein